jgi:Holliday junction resolvase
MKTEKEKKSQKVIRSRPKAKSPNSGARARRKGHNYERNIVKFFKDLGFEQAKTSRLGSRLLDAAKVDICDIPFNVQCKAVEAHIDYYKLTEEISAELAKLVPKRVEYPVIIFHKKNKKTNVVMTMDEFSKFFKAMWSNKLIYDHYV